MAPLDTRHINTFLINLRNTASLQIKYNNVCKGKSIVFFTQFRCTIDRNWPLVEYSPLTANPFKATLPINRDTPECQPCASHSTELFTFDARVSYSHISSPVLVTFLVGVVELAGADDEAALSSSGALAVRQKHDVIGASDLTALWRHSAATRLHPTVQRLIHDDDLVMFTRCLEHVTVTNMFNTCQQGINMIR